jgi:iron complex outermembrane receptor protein
MGPGAGAAQERTAGDTVPPDSAVQLPGIEVTAASRIPGGGVTRAAEILDRKTLNELPVSTLTEALRWGVGLDLQARSPAQADLSVRGGSFEQVLVLVDGVPVSDAQTGHFDLNLTVPLDLVERVEVVRGPSSSLHGADAVGGVVNVVTRRGEGVPAGRIRLEGGSFGAVQGAAYGSLPLGSRWRSTASVQSEESDGHRDGVDHRATLVHASLSGPAVGGELRITGGWARRDFGADGFYAPAPSYEETRSRRLAARWNRPVGAGDLTVQAFHRRHDDDFVLRRSDPAFYRNLHTSRQNGVEASVRFPMATGVALVVGGQAVREELESTNLGDRVEDRGAGFVEAGYDRGPLRIRGGVRMEGRDNFGAWAAPSVSAGWDVAPALRLRGAVGRSYRIPTFTERYYEDPANVGRPDLDPESAWTTEVGADVVVASAVVRATVYRRDASGLVDWARPAAADESVPWETRNVESATFDGVEIQVDGVRAGPATLEFAGSLIDVESAEVEGFVSKYALRPLTRNLMAGVRLPLPGGLDLATRVQNQRRVGEATRTVGDVRLSAPVLDGRAWVDVTNLTDATYPDITGLPAPGRAIRTGLRLPFGG